MSASLNRWKKEEKSFLAATYAISQPINASFFLSYSERGGLCHACVLVVVVAVAVNGLDFFLKILGFFFVNGWAGSWVAQIFFMGYNVYEYIDMRIGGENYLLSLAQDTYKISYYTQVYCIPPDQTYSLSHLTPR